MYYSIALLLTALLLWEIGVFNANNNATNYTDAEITGNLPETNEKDLYGYFKDFVVQNGTTNGDYVSFSKSADNYGGDANGSFSATYWGDTDTIEISLSSVLDDNYSIRYYIKVPKTYTGKYEYIASYYYRATGEPLMEVQGYINSATFTQNSPLENTTYYGDKSMQNDFTGLARLGACSTLYCLDEFLTKEKTGYTLQSIGFKNF